MEKALLQIFQIYLKKYNLPQVHVQSEVIVKKEMELKSSFILARPT